MAGPKRVLLMDEITSGLDSATAFKEVKALRDMVHTLKVWRLAISILEDPRCTPPPLTWLLPVVCASLRHK